MLSKALIINFTNQIVAQEIRALPALNRFPALMGSLIGLLALIAKFQCLYDFSTLSELGDIALAVAIVPPIIPDSNSGSLKEGARLGQVLGGVPAGTLPEYEHVLIVGLYNVPPDHNFKDIPKNTRVVFNFLAKAATQKVGALRVL